MKVALLTFVLATALASCATRTEYVSTPLVCPGKPELPRITAVELDALSDEAYRKVVTRDRRLREYAEELLAVCESTHQEKGE